MGGRICNNLINQYQLLVPAPAQFLVASPVSHKEHISSWGKLLKRRNRENSESYYKPSFLSSLFELWPFNILYRKTTA